MTPVNLIKLAVSFFRIGLVAFGGGYTVIPLLQREAVEHRQWITHEELTDIMAISQTLPGIIMVNSATMIGCRVGGFWGGLVATTAAICPTIILTLLITTLFWNFTDLVLVKKAFTGILLGVTALIVYAVGKMWKTVVKSRFDLILVILASVLLILFKVNAVLVILGVAAMGYGYNLYRNGTGSDNI